MVRAGCKTGLPCQVDCMHEIQTGRFSIPLVLHAFVYPAMARRTACSGHTANDPEYQLG